jgi:preprotein translocase subunit YajC
MNILLMAPQGGEQGGSPYSSLIFLLLIVVVFYFFMIRPQMKKQKEIKKFRESLAAGDKIVTSGGIHGKVISIDETSILIEVDKDVKIRVDKGAVINNPVNAQQPK